MLNSVVSKGPVKQVLRKKKGGKKNYISNSILEREISPKGCLRDVEKMKEMKDRRKMSRIKRLLLLITGFIKPLAWWEIIPLLCRSPHLGDQGVTAML